MLTQAQRTRLKKGFRQGFPDNILAEQLALSPRQVARFRHTLEIDVKVILENRLNTWIELIHKGGSPDAIAHAYGVKPNSLRQMLWREKRFSFREAKKLIPIPDHASMVATAVRKLGMVKARLLGLI